MERDDTNSPHPGSHEGGFTPKPGYYTEGLREPTQAAADRELVEQLENLATLMNEQNPDLGAIVIGAALRLKELTSA